MSRTGQAGLIGLALVFTAPVSAQPALQQQLLETVQGFYSWTLTHGKATAALAPTIKDQAGGPKFYLDTTTLKPFTESFLASGYFSPQFAQAVERYYTHYQRQFSAMRMQEFKQIAKDGRGPLMEVEDMDLFFCAQEYDYTPEFIQSLKVSAFSQQGDSAKLEVESSYQWKTEFIFQQQQGKWLITGYCVFK